MAKTGSIINKLNIIRFSNNIWPYFIFLWIFKWLLKFFSVVFILPVSNIFFFYLYPIWIIGQVFLFLNLWKNNCRQMVIEFYVLLLVLDFPLFLTKLIFLSCWSCFLHSPTSKTKSCYGLLSASCWYTALYTTLVAFLHIPGCASI